MIGRVIVLMAMLFGMGLTPLPSRGAEPPQPPPLDLAWITLRPSDFPEPGYLNTTRSAWEDRWEAPQTMGGGLEGFLLILDAQVNAGWIQAHRAAITLPEAPGSEWAVRKAFIHLTQLSSAEGAAYYLSEYCDALYPASDFTEVAAEVAVGDETRFYTQHGTLPQWELAYAHAALVFRSGDVMAEVLLADFTNVLPSQQEMLGLAQAVQTRLEQARLGEAPGLSLMHPRYAGEDALVAESVYRVSEGDLLPWYRAASIDEDGLLHRVAAQQAESIYTWSVRLPGPRPDGRYNWYHAQLTSFLNDEAAQDYLADQSWSGETATFPTFGDASSGRWYEVPSDGATMPLHGWSGRIRVGSTVAEVWFAVQREIRPEDVTAIGEAMASCMRSLACTEWEDLPSTLSGVGYVPPTATPSAEASPTVPVAATITTREFAFEPEVARVVAGIPVRLRIVNDGVIPHNFSIDALDLDVDLAPGATEVITLTLDAGSYEFFCDIPGHREAGMVGTLVAE